MALNFVKSRDDLAFSSTHCQCFLFCSFCLVLFISFVLFIFIFFIWWWRWALWILFHVNHVNNHHELSTSFTCSNGRHYKLCSHCKTVSEQIPASSNSEQVNFKGDDYCDVCFDLGQ